MLCCGLLAGLVAACNPLGGESSIDSSFQEETRLSFRRAPTLTKVDPLDALNEDVPTPFSYYDLVGAADENDPEGATVTFRIEGVTQGSLTKGGVAVVPGSTFIAPGDQLVWTPPTDANGVLPAFSVKAYDGELFSSLPVTVAFNVPSVNDAPTISAIADQNVPAGGSLSGISFRVDEGGSSFENSQVLTVTATSSNTAVLPSALITTSYLDNAAGDASLLTPSISIMAAGLVVGVATVTVTVTDSLGASAQTSFDVKVSFLPPSLTGLRVWLRADGNIVKDASTGAVSLWRDESGLNNHAVPAAGAVPHWVDGVANGKPVVRFDGVADSFDLPDAMSGATAGEAFVVVKKTADPPASAARSGLWAFGASGAATHFPFTNGVIYDDFGSTTRATTVDPALPLTQFSIYSAMSSAGKWRNRLNGKFLADATTPNTVGFPVSPKLGSNGGTVYLDGDVAELAVYGRDLSELERQRIEAYLAVKYGVDLMPSANRQVWLQADAGVTKDASDRVAVWGDRSGNAYDVAQADGAKQPLWVATAAQGRPAIRFAGNEHLVRAAGLPIGGDPSLSIFEVQMPGAATGDRCAFGFGDPAGTMSLMSFCFGTRGDGVFSLDYDSVSGVVLQAYSTTAYQLASMTRRPGAVDATTRFFLDGIEQVAQGASASGVPALSAAQPFAVGAYAPDTQPFAGEIAELLLYNSLQPELERQRIETLLAEKYALQNAGTAPLNIRDLRLWLKSDVGVVKDAFDRVSAWQDQSGNGVDLSQASAGVQPLWVSKVLNGHPAIRFTKTRLDWMDSVALPASDQWSYVVVSRKNDTNTSRNAVLDVEGKLWLYHQFNAGAHQVVSQFGPSVYCCGALSVITTATPATFQIQLFTISAAGTAELWVNGASKGTGSLATGSVAPRVALGKRFDTGPLVNESLEGDIVEVQIYSRQLSAGDRTQLQCDLSRRYGITVPGC